MKTNTKSILFLPFLQIPSGHHQAAQAIIDDILSIYPQIRCDKVDILSYSYGKIESLVSKVYLKWIHAFPGVYNSIYQNSVYKNIEKEKRYRLYEVLFLYFMKRLIQEKQPDLIVCTHALPAYMLNFLKGNKELKVPVVNVYTDYFIHRFWGIEHIDFHFVPSYQMKTFLNQKGISDERIFITGIPIHSKIKKQEQTPLPSVKPVPSILISGGNLGVGGMEDLIQRIAGNTTQKQMKFYVLCGKNKDFYNKLKGMHLNHIIPFSYIDCREKMNALYDQIDAIITKPGGVTISESLFKRKPIFIYHTLPGQEEINLQQLKGLGVVFPLNKPDIVEQLFSILQDQQKLQQYQLQVANFHSYIHSKEPSEIIAELLIGH
ncbi:UDP-N-acetylglucosamine:LPS N-acetylglucosamine transferase [Bacillus pakistanensis]|uniref:UDP-N-acetylglucosamine:LPS N-acetylglucosamine transferase n=1 Tax=Rossellomorea pakistanensis TaxID=992288 RepID=A0ABS2NH05_9BACI|nr:glycosyltransferase [Bacillus pakistanensis]MBM7587136.1 UDP-N-acetylglucosamine:LPS N-acetylglucosamine transferase [Bacillus pakistanensis]